jgi:Secretion system C-terminal sorting domain/Beta-propeller repeat
LNLILITFKNDFGRTIILKLNTMKTTITFVTVVMLLIITQAFSQPAEEWVARYDSGNTDQLYSMTVDVAGNVYAAGASVQVPFTADYLTIKYNSSGVKQWEKIYEGIAGSDDRAYAMAVDDSGNVYVTGGTGYDNSIVTIKYNSLGDSLWARSYIGPASGHNWTFAQCIFVDDSGNVYVAGTSEGLVGVHGLFQDYTTIKYSPDGVQLWVARFNGPGTDADVVNSMAVDALGNVYVTGFAGGGSTGSGDSYNDITTIKYNLLGDSLWTRTYKGPGTSSDEGTMLTVDNLGNVYVTGETDLGITNGKDIITLKYNSDGTELWKKFYNGTGSGSDHGAALAVDAMHNIYVTGESNFGAPNGLDIITLKYDSLGTQLWAKNFNGSSNSNEVSEAITLDTDGNVYTCGTSVNTTTAEDFQLIKYNPAGTQLWEKKYTYSNAAGSEEYAAALFVDDLNNIYAAGMSALDFAIVKYSLATTVEEVQRQFAASIFPNPSDGKFTIKTDQLSFDVAEFYNILGERVYFKTDFKQQTSNEFDLSELQKGIYFVKLCAGVNVLTKRLVIQ